VDVLSQEFKLTGTTDSLLWIAGAYYSKDEMDEVYHYFFSDSLFGLGSIPFGVSPFQFAPILELDTRYQQETESAAVFGHVEWQASEKVRLTAGLRYTEEERSWSGCTFDAGDGSLAGFINFAFGASLPPGHCGTIDDDPTSPNFVFGVIGTPAINSAFHVYEETINTDKWMGKFGIDYALSDDVLFYTSYSSGFKSGGFNGANSNTTLQLQSYKAETLDSIELGMKSTLLDGRMQLNLAVFDYDYTDKQEQDLAVTFVGNISGLTNVPKAAIQGAEIDLKWLVSERLQINFGAAYLDTKIEEWQATSRASSFPTVVTFDASGFELAQSPQWQVNSTIEYGWNLANGMNMSIATDINYKGDTTGGAQSTDATESYTVANLRVALSSPDNKWRALVWSRNVTDEYYYPAAYVGGNGPFVRSVGLPRTVGLSLTYNF
jgi:iron complex outermembrane receptor protein